MIFSMFHKNYTMKLIRETEQSERKIEQTIYLSVQSDSDTEMNRVCLVKMVTVLFSVSLSIRPKEI